MTKEEDDEKEQPQIVECDENIRDRRAKETEEKWIHQKRELETNQKPMR